MRRFVRLISTPLCLAGTTLLAGCASLEAETPATFTYQSIPIAKTSTRAGEGSTISFRGSTLPLTGSGISQGELLRSVELTKSDLSLINISDTRGTIRIFSIVPSLDTKVCEQQTHYLSEKNQGLDARVDLYTISVDTPFAQARFAQEAGIQNMTFLSDYREAAFGKTYGLLLEGPHLLGRAIIVVDQQNIVRHIQVNPDLATMPDMGAAFSVARSLLTP